MFQFTDFFKYTKMHEICFSCTDIIYKIIMNKNMRCNLTIKKGDKRTPHWGAILPYVCITIHQTSILTKDCRLRLKRCIVRVLYSCAIILLEKHKLMHVSTTHHLFWYSSISHFFSFPQHQS